MSLRYMLDTNIVSELVRDNRGPVARKLMDHGLEAFAVSTVVTSELRFGYVKRSSERLAELVEDVIGYLTIIPFDESASRNYASIRATLERQGSPIGPNDLFIAAHARSLDLTLVTDNIREFSRVEGLKLENWIERQA